MIQQIFIGGHFSSGTRVLQFLLEQTHNTGAKGEERDYEAGFSKTDGFVAKVLRGERPEWVREEKPNRVMPAEPFSIKNPDLMMVAPYIKELFPDSKFILVVRNGLDQILCDNRRMSERYIEYLNLHQEEFFKREMEYWNNIYKWAIERGGIDLFIRLEDLIFNTEKTVNRLVDLLKIPYPDTSMIKIPDSINRRNKEYIIKTEHTPKEPQGEEYIYNPSMKKELYEIGREMLNYFKYEY